MSDTWHAPGPDGLLGASALCGTTVDTTGALTLVDDPEAVTCLVCRDLQDATQETP